MAETDSITYTLRDRDYDHIVNQFQMFFLSLYGLQALHREGTGLIEVDINALMGSYDLLYSEVCDMFKKEANNE